MAQVAEKPSYGSIEDLIACQPGSIHIECAREATRRAVHAVRSYHAGRRCGFYVATDGGLERETVGSYLRFFSRLANTGASVEKAAERFGLLALRRKRLCKLDREQLALLNFARLELFDPEVCFCERPLDALGPVGRSAVLSWMNELAARGTVFITAGQPLREALLMPGVAFWEDEGRYVAAEVVPEGDPEPASGPDPDEAEGPLYAGDEVRICKIPAKADAATLLFDPREIDFIESMNKANYVSVDEVRICKIPAKADAATLLFDPREIDFIESMNKANYVSVRGELYQTPLTMDELDGELAPFGFFRCHRSYIVNVQRVARVERYTRNAFNLTLSDPAGTCIPLAKGRADALRATLRF